MKRGESGDGSGGGPGGDVGGNISGGQDCLIGGQDWVENEA